jgi:acyl-CoA synthetase (AMP-forming)/AMP-acid ligase II
VTIGLYLRGNAQPDRRAAQARHGRPSAPRTRSRGCGESIYPKEIENVLYRHADVLEAAVVGRPHDVLGEEPVAFVALRVGARATCDELLDLCVASLARYKAPREVIVVDALPKNAVGKISKPLLRERLARLVTET